MVEHMNMEKDIIKLINSMSGARTPYDIFYDWVHLDALVIANSCTLIHDSVWKSREDEYIKTIEPYGKEGERFAELSAMLTVLLEDHMSDHLGHIYMSLGMGSKTTGQFFTPYHVSKAMAMLAIPEEVPDPFWINEPTCGAGGMLIAAAEELKGRGINYQKRMRAVAQDLDWRAVYMCYVQLSLYGINAVVVQGNTLADPEWQARPKECIFRTPNNKGVLI